MAKNQKLIPSSVVCEQLGIDRSTLSRWVAAGKLKPVMKLAGIRGSFLFDAATIDRKRFIMTTATMRRPLTDDNDRDQS